MNPSTSSRPSGASDRKLSVIRSPRPDRARCRPPASIRSRTAPSHLAQPTAAQSPTVEHRVVRAAPQRTPLRLVPGDGDRPQPERLPGRTAGGTDVPAAPCTSSLTRLRPPAGPAQQAGQVVEWSGRACPVIPSGSGRTRSAGTLMTSCQQPYDTRTRPARPASTGPDHTRRVHARRGGSATRIWYAPRVGAGPRRTPPRHVVTTPPPAPHADSAYLEGLRRLRLPEGSAPKARPPGPLISSGPVNAAIL
jgi:hypothetical protein